MELTKIPSKIVVTISCCCPLWSSKEASHELQDEIMQLKDVILLTDQH